MCLNQNAEKIARSLFIVIENQIIVQVDRGRYVGSKLKTNIVLISPLNLEIGAMFNRRNFGRNIRYGEKGSTQQVCKIRLYVAGHSAPLINQKPHSAWADISGYTSYYLGKEIKIYPRSFRSAT